MTWVAGLRPLQAHRSAALDARQALHTARCPAALDGLGQASGRTCRCGAEGHIIPASTPVEQIHTLGEAALVRWGGLAPVWVEGALLRPTAPPPVVERDTGAGPPADITRLEEAIARGLPERKAARRRAPRGGELVWVRADLAQGRSLPWRYFGRVHIDGKPHIVLLDPHLRLHQATHPAHVHTRVLPIPDGECDPARVVICVWPLPDGTTDPGWRSR